MIVKRYYQNGESLIATIPKVLSIFGRQNVPNSFIVKRIIEKFESTGSVGDVNHMRRARRSRSKQTITAARERVAKSPEMLIRHYAHELDI